MGLIDKIKKGAVALGLAGTMAFSGCETTPDGRIFFLNEQIGRQIPANEQNSANDEVLLWLGLIGIGFGRNSPGAVATGQSIVNYAGQKVNKSQVNIKIENNSIKPGIIENNNFKVDNYFFECNNYLSDLNKNSLYDIDEFSGIKNVFSVSEPITFVFRVLKRDGLLEGIVYDKENREIIKRINGIVNNAHPTGYVPYGSGSFKPGKYAITWQMGNDILANREFEITQ